MKLKRGVKITIAIILLLIVGIIVLCFFLNRNNGKKVQEVKVLKEITEYGYQLKENRSKEYKNLFDELTKILQQEEVDEEEYAKLVSQLFIMDFYTLDDKIAKTDIGGVEFVHSLEREDFTEKAMNTIYKYVQSNVYGDRKQQLPCVREVTVESVEKTSFSYSNTTDSNAYQVKLAWVYEKDMEYEKEATLILVHEDIKLSVVEMD